MPTLEEKRIIERAELQEKQRQERLTLREQQTAETKRRENKENWERKELERDLKEKYLNKESEQKKEHVALKEKMDSTGLFIKKAREIIGELHQFKQRLKTLETSIKQSESNQRTARMNLGSEQGRAQDAEHARHNQQTERLNQQHSAELMNFKNQYIEKREAIVEDHDKQQDAAHHRPRPPAGMAHTKPTEQTQDTPTTEQQETAEPLTLKREWYITRERDTER